MGKTMYKSTYADVEIDIDDVEDYIRDYATENDLKKLGKILDQKGVYRSIDIVSVNDEYKLELLLLAYSKYSLQELEDRLGTFNEL